MTDKPRRRRFKKSEYYEVRRRQGFRCAMCGEPLEGRVFEYDHELAWELGGPDELWNLRAICKRPCHAAKTASDRRIMAKVRGMRLFHETGRSSAKKHVQKIPSRPLDGRGRKLEGRGFDKRLSKKMDGRVVARKEDRHA